MRARVSYDVIDRISIGTLCRAIADCIRGRTRLSINQYLSDSGIVAEGKNVAYFNYGRNALYTLFREKFAGKEVIFPGFVCPTVVIAAIKAGVKPRFADVNLDDFNLNIDLISPEDLMKADALFLNHTFGVPADMDKIRRKLKGSDTYLIEDIAQALFSTYKGEYVGRLGDVTLLSMYKQIPNLNGALLLSDFKVDEPVSGAISLGNLTRLLWITSGPHDYLIKAVRRRKGLPGALNELQENLTSRRPSQFALSLFAILLPSLKDAVERRRIIARHYHERASESRYLVPQQVDAVKKPSWFNFSVRLLPEIAHIRDALLIGLRRQGVFGDRLWHDSPVAINMFQDYLQNDYPSARLLAKSVINLPIKADYRESDADYLFGVIERTIQKLV